MSMTATGAAAKDAREGHPATGPPAMPRDAFCAILAARGRVLAPRAETIQDLAGTMLVDPEKRVSGAAAQAHISP